jgi:hypothetical protein
LASSAVVVIEIRAARGMVHARSDNITVSLYASVWDNTDDPSGLFARRGGETQSGPSGTLLSQGNRWVARLDQFRLATVEEGDLGTGQLSSGDPLTWQAVTTIGAT